MSAAPLQVPDPSRSISCLIGSLPPVTPVHPSVVAVDPSFEAYRLGLAKIERLATGMRWSEGPVWLGDTRALVWSDVPGNTMYRFDEVSGKVSCSHAVQQCEWKHPATVRAVSSPAST